MDGEEDSGPDAASFDAGLGDAGRADGGGRDAGAPDAGRADAAALVVSGAPALYRGDRTQSPVDSEVAQRLKDIAAAGAGRAQVFMKVGDSIRCSSPSIAFHLAR